MEAKHTPGPWDYRFNNPGSSSIGYIFSRDDEEIAVLYNCESKMDASLIAAAPELLEELKSLVAWISEHDAEAYERQLNNAKAAIAKAEGK